MAVVITLIILTYLCFSVWVSKGIPISISNTYYLLGNKGWIFQVFLCLLAVLLYIVWFPLVSEYYQYFPFLCCSSLLFVASAPCFKEELQGNVHYSSAIISCVCDVLWQVLEGLWDVTLWFGVIGFMLTLMNKSKWCWWLECSVIGSLIFNLLRLI